MRTEGRIGFELKRKGYRDQREKERTIRGKYELKEVSQKPLRSIFTM
jgi:hypothetical protein